MNNKLIKRRPNKLLAGRNNYFAFGDFMFNKDKEGNVTDRSLDNLSGTGQGILSAAGTTIGQLGGGLIGGGLSSGVGNAVSSLSGIASAIPGVGGFISAGLGLAGGVINRLFGSKLNEENIARVENNINQLNNFKSGASSFDTLSQTWMNAPTGMTFEDSYIGRDGIFSNKAKNKASNLRTQVASGNAWVQNSLDNNAENISNTQMQNLLSNYKSFGGHLMTNGADFTNGITVVGNGGTHEENPNEGVQMGVDPEGIPNLVEEGEVVYNDYVFSNRLIVPKSVRNKYKLRGTKTLTFADAAKQLGKEAEERPNDNISQNGLDDSMMKLMVEQEKVRSSKDKNTYAKGGKLGRKYFDGSILLSEPIDMNDFSWMQESEDEYNKRHGIEIPDTSKSKASTSNYPNFDNWLRYAPVVGSAIGLGTSLFSSPDFSEATAIQEASKAGASYRPIKYTPVGNYLTYKPFDRSYHINTLNAGAGAARRAILNTSGGNRAQAMAGLLAADSNYINQLGALARQAEEFNLAQRQAVEDFNRATNIQNAQGALEADKANQSAWMVAKESEMRGVMEAAKLRQKAKLARENAISANTSNIFESLGNIGREQVDRKWRTWAAEHGVYAPVQDPSKAKGGIIRRKRKKGLTF